MLLARLSTEGLCLEVCTPAEDFELPKGDVVMYRVEKTGHQTIHSDQNEGGLLENGVCIRIYERRESVMYGVQCCANA